MQNISHSIRDRVKKESGKVAKEIKKQTISYVVASLGLIAGLAWNEAIKSLIEHLFPLNKNSVIIKFIYAGLITIVIVLITVYLVRLLTEEESIDPNVKVE